MDILLIEPPPTNQYGNMRQFGSIGTYKADIAYPPIDLMKIAGYIRQYGIKALIYDANTLKASIQDVSDLIIKEKPKLIVFTTSTTAIKNDMQVAKRAKEISKDILTAAFGAHIKGAPYETLKENNCLDIAIYGDQEYVVREIAGNGYKIENVKGIYYRKNSDIIKNEPHPVISNLDEYGIAAHDMIRPELYHDPFAKKRPLTITYGQVGCINRCSYCMSTLYTAEGMRTRSVPHFMEELKYILKVGFREVFFIDCGLTNNTEWVNSLLDSMIKDAVRLSWWCLSRGDRLDSNLLRKMKRAGCHSVGIGVESANSEILKNIRKQVDINYVKDIIIAAHKLGIRILLYFQFGLPGETKETMRETLNYALSSGADLATFGIATPVPGTEFYNYIKENNFFITKDWAKFDPALPPVYEYPNLKSGEIFEFSKKAYRTFYMRPSFILKRFLTQRSLNDIENNWNNFLQFINRNCLSR